jgi:hypothetical protein
MFGGAREQAMPNPASVSVDTPWCTESCGEEGSEVREEERERIEGRKEREGGEGSREGIKVRGEARRKER